MKTLYFTICLVLLIAISGSAQDTIVQPKSLISADSKITGWFVDVHNAYSEYDSKSNYMPGFSGGAVLNRNFRVGFAAKSLSWYPESVTYDDLFDEAVYLEGGYGGLFIESSPFENKVLHFTFPLTIGGGEYRYRSVKEYQETEDEGEIDYGHRTLSHAPFFVIEPGVNLELNLTGFLRVYAGITYCWVPGSALSHVSNGVFNNAKLNFGIKIGKF